MSISTYVYFAPFANTNCSKKLPQKRICLIVQMYVIYTKMTEFSNILLKNILENGIYFILLYCKIVPNSCFEQESGARTKIPKMMAKARALEQKCLPLYSQYSLKTVCYVP